MRRICCPTSFDEWKIAPAVDDPTRLCEQLGVRSGKLFARNRLPARPPLKLINWVKRKRESVAQLA